MKNLLTLRLSSRLGRALLVLSCLIGPWCSLDLVAQRGSAARPAPPPATAPQAPAGLGLELKEQPSNSGQQVSVVSVRANSLAAAAGFAPGDVLVKLMDEPVHSNVQVAASVQAWLATSASTTADPLQFVVRRGRSEVKLQITAAIAANAARPAPAPNDRSARLRNSRRGAVVATGTHHGPAVGSVSDPFAIPGVATAVPRVPDAGAINVLQRVFLEPATGELVFIGRHDPAYATGAIDYSTLLSDALRSPAPSFSLEPTDASRAAGATFIRQFDQQMKTNLGDVAAGKAWLLGMFDQLLNNPALETDRRRFLARGAEILGLPANEIPGSVRGMLGQAPAGSPEWARFWAQCYSKLGSEGGAIFVRAGAADDAAGFNHALNRLGVRPTIDSIRQQMQSGALSNVQGQAQAEVAIWCAIFRDCGVPESRWRVTADRAGRSGDLTPFRAMVDDINANLARERIIEPWLNGLVLSEAYLQSMHHLPPLEVAPIYQEGLAADSELARTFLAADWTLKTLGTTPELAERVPGHVTPSQFAFRLEAERNVYELGDLRVRFWLVPESVPLLAAPDGSVVAFGDARPGVRAKILSHDRCNSAAARRLAEDAMQGYAAMLTSRYADYARALPDLHRLRETAKILALVRWAQARGTRLAPPAPATPAAPLPTRFQRGFWTGNFDSAGGRTFFGLVAIGGVDFGADAGTAWVQTRVDPALRTTALDQLVGSAALGRAAVEAAARGDLESARTLADQSARAMTGDFDFTGHPALPQIPEASPPSPVDAALLHTEILAQTRQNIETMERAQKVLRQAGAGDLPRTEAQGKWAQAEQNLAQLQTLLTTRTSPLPARQVVQLLRNGEWEKLPKPVAAATPTSPPPAEPVAVAVDPEESARIRGEITQLRTELCRVQTQLRRFNTTIQSDQDQRAEWEKVTNDAYENALKRAQEKFEEFSVDFPEGILKEKLAAATDPAERAKIERALRLVDRFKDAYTTRDFSEWAAKEEFTREEIIEGIKQLVSICGIDERLKDYLGKKWGLKRAIAFYEAGDELLTSAYDVTAEIVAWRRLQQLNRNSDGFLKATEASGRRLRELIAAIHEREVRLGLDPGSTKEPCATP